MIIKSIFFNFLFYFSIAFFGILFLPLLFSEKLTRKGVKFWAILIIFLLRKIIGVKIIYQNQYIFKKRGYLLAANHQSVFDTIFFLKEFDKVIYIVKKELKYIPIYGWYASRLGNIFVDRNKRIESIKHISENVCRVLKMNYKVIIFPEGTRQLEKKIGKIKPGIFILQKFCKSLVYPVYINSYCVWPKNDFIKKSKSIKVKVLAPLEYEESKMKFICKLKNCLEVENKKNNL